jgi:2-(1,2-epoxy-1,2-dihydrophenyl)acetyl-CoA isomerase
VLRLQKQGPVAHLTLDRPRNGNAINAAMARALLQASEEVSRDETIRLVVLTGEGRLFCGGGDVQAFADPKQKASAAIDEITGPLHAAMSGFACMNKPLMTVVNGPAGGAGLSLALLGDIVVAVHSAHFTASYTAIGLTPDGGLSWILPRLIGLRRAQELILTNRRLSAAEALDWGLITCAVADEQLANAVEELIERLISSASGALGEAKRLLRSSPHASFETQMEIEARTIATRADSAEGQEGISAFLGQRKPVYWRPY